MKDSEQQLDADKDDIKKKQSVSKEEEHTVVGNRLESSTNDSDYFSNDDSESTIDDIERPIKEVKKTAENARLAIKIAEKKVKKADEIKKTADILLAANIKASACVKAASYHLVEPAEKADELVFKDNFIADDMLLVKTIELICNEDENIIGDKITEAKAAAEKAIMAKIMMKKAKKAVYIARDTKYLLEIVTQHFCDIALKEERLELVARKEAWKATLAAAVAKYEAAKAVKVAENGRTANLGENQKEEIAEDETQKLIDEAKKVLDLIIAKAVVEAKEAEDEAAEALKKVNILKEPYISKKTKYDDMTIKVNEINKKADDARDALVVAKEVAKTAAKRKNLGTEDSLAWFKAIVAVNEAAKNAFEIAKKAASVVQSLLWAGAKLEESIEKAQIATVDAKRLARVFNRAICSAYNAAVDIENATIYAAEETITSTTKDLAVADYEAAVLLRKELFSYYIAAEKTYKASKKTFMEVNESYGIAYDTAEVDKKYKKAIIVCMEETKEECKNTFMTVFRFAKSMVYEVFNYSGQAMAKELYENVESVLNVSNELIIENDNLININKNVLKKLLNDKKPEARELSQDFILINSKLVEEAEKLIFESDEAVRTGIVAAAYVAYMSSGCNCDIIEVFFAWNKTLIIINKTLDKIKAIKTIIAKYHETNISVNAAREAMDTLVQAILNAKNGEYEGIIVAIKEAKLLLKEAEALLASLFLSETNKNDEKLTSTLLFLTLGDFVQIDKKDEKEFPSNSASEVRSRNEQINELLASLLLVADCKENADLKFALSLTTPEELNEKARNTEKENMSYYKINKYPPV